MELKTVPLAEFKITADSGPGEFTGRAAQFNGLDSYGDTIMPGAFAKTIPGFLDRGFLAAGHDWTAPIGWFTSAEERADGLYITGKFHSDDEAQKHRTRARERMDAGRFVGLSIGYVTKDAVNRDDGVRELREIELYETSLVTVPADRGAGLTAVKSGLPFAVELEAARDAVRSALERSEQLVALRASDGRSLNPENWGRISALAADWDEFAIRFKELLAEQQQEEPPEDQPNPEEEEVDEQTAVLRSIAANFQQFDAFYTGVAWKGTP